jgi:hypothetical protein
VSDQVRRTERALNILGKWRVLFAGWQLGTRSKTDPECAAVRDHREATLMLRVEVTALCRVLREAEVIDFDFFLKVLEEEADMLCMALEERFPGVHATEEGLAFDPRVNEWMKGWRP